MAVLAYIAVILIWSTTPLAIKLGNDSLPPIAAVSLRMGFAFIGGILVMCLWRKAGRLHFKNIKSYALASITIFPTMPLVYYSAEYISSGLISVLFGLMPLVSAVFASLLLGENLWSLRRVFAQAVAFSGLLMISLNQLNFKEHAFYGVLLSVSATVIYAWGSVYLKRFNQTQKVPAFEQTVGALLFSLPGMFISWWIIEDSFWVSFSVTSAWSVGYLAIVGSLMGFVAFFCVLERMTMSLVSMIPVITPMLALCLGVMVAGEQLTAITLLGAVMIIMGLILYQGIPQLIWKKLRRN